MCKAIQSCAICLYAMCYCAILCYMLHKITVKRQYNAIHANDGVVHPCQQLEKEPDDIERSQTLAVTPK